MASGCGEQTQDQKTEVPKDLPFFFEQDKTMCSILLDVIQGLRDYPHLKYIRDKCVKKRIPLSNVTTKDPVSTQILTPKKYMKKVKQGIIHRMPNHDVIEFITDNIPDTTTQVVSMQFSDLRTQ